jgi:hypothetical protein
MSKGRLIGAAIIVKNIPFNMDKNCSAFREIGDDLIKQTLEQTSQNLSLNGKNFRHRSFNYLSSPS